MTDKNIMQYKTSFVSDFTNAYLPMRIRVDDHSRFFNPPDWKKECKYDGEDHLDVGPLHEPEHAQDGEVYQLETGECVDLPLGHPLDIVVGRVGGLLSEEEKKPLEHLVAV